MVRFQGYGVSVPLLRAAAPLGIAVAALALLALGLFQTRGAPASAAAPVTVDS
jgi:hypothetical protein